MGSGVFLFMCYSGPPDNGEKVVAPVREFGSPLEDMLEPMTYCQVQQAFDADFPFGLKNYWKSSNVKELSDDAIDTMVAFMEAAPSIAPMVIIDQFGGAVARVPDHATAFGQREAEYDLIIAAIWSDDAEQEAHVEWAKSFWEAMQPYSTESVYVNYLSEEGEERVRAAYGREHHARLVQLKRQYDRATCSGTTRTSARTERELQCDPGPPSSDCPVPSRPVSIRREPACMNSWDGDATVVLIPGLPVAPGTSGPQDSTQGIACSQPAGVIRVWGRMGEVSLPKYHELLWPTLQALK
jgi:hypothetical protein